MKKDGENKILWSGGVFIEIVKDQRIVLTDHPANAAGFDGPSSEIGEAYITVEFQKLNDNRTMMSLFHEGLPAGIHDECVEGWSSSLDKLKKLVESH